jgi:hypothetical protein
MSVTVSLTEADLQPFASRIEGQPAGFELYRLADDQAADASGGTFHFEIKLNAGRSLYPRYWTIVQFISSANGASWTFNPSINVDPTERFEKWERWTQDTYTIWSGERFVDGTTGLSGVQGHSLNPFPIYLGRPLLPPVTPTASQGEIIVQSSNVNGSTQAFNMVLAASNKPLPWPSYIRL